MKTRMITRTVKETVCEVMVTNIEAMTVGTKYVSVYGAYDEKTLNKIVSKKIEDENDTNIKYVCIKKVAVREEIYGMTEEEFVALAKPIER